MADTNISGIEHTQIVITEQKSKQKLYDDR